MPNPNAPPKPSQPRSSSRPNSASSSSVVTVQRAPSLSSRSGSKTPRALGRPQSPSDSNPSAPSAQTALTPDQSRNLLQVHGRPSSVGGINDGLGTLNRWSQSTVSSRNSGHGHGRSFSRRLSLGGSSSIASPKSFTNGPSSPSRNVLTKPRTSPGKPPSAELPPSPPMTEASSIGILPPIITLPALTQAADDATPSTAATPATAELLTPSTFNNADYFGDRWRRKSPTGNRPMESQPGHSPQIETPVPPSLHVRNVSLEPTNPRNVPGFSPDKVAPRQARGQDPNYHVGHTRANDDNGKGSAGTAGGSSTSSIRSEKRHKPPSQKAMLSKALQKANTAVLLDNAQNFEGAMEAYADACNLLQHVLERSSGDEDRKKLEAIKNTYTNRINELRNLDVSYQVAEGKALPERPMSNDSTISQSVGSPTDGEDEEAAVIGTATATRIVNTPSYVTNQLEPRSLAPTQIPPRRQSLLPSAFDEEVRFSNGSPVSHHSKRRSQSKSPRRDVDRSISLAAPFDPSYMPPPLSPRRVSSPTKHDPSEQDQTESAPVVSSTNHGNHHMREMSTETTSWLDTIDESGGSSNSSVHSRFSSWGGIYRKPLHKSGEQTEAEFDAALDAAVEAAYNDGFEIAEDEFDDGYAGDDVISIHRRNVELAKQRVRQVEIETELARAVDQKKQKVQQGPSGEPRSDGVDIEYGDEEAEEEERLLEEMTKSLVMDDFEFELQSSKSALPRTSDSSGFSGRTWGSSGGSNSTTAGTSLSTVAEAQQLPSLISQMQPKLPPPHPPPMGALPAPPQSSNGPSHVSTQPSHPPPSVPVPRPPTLSPQSGPGVRERRLSGQNVKQLKIETHSRLPPSVPKKDAHSGPPPSVPAGLQQGFKPQPALPTTRPPPASSQLPAQAQLPQPALPPVPRSPVSAQRNDGPKITESPATPAVDREIVKESDDTMPPLPPSPANLVKMSSASETLRKNQPVTTLKTRNLSVSVPDASDVSPSTPISSGFTGTVEARKGVTATLPVMPTPTGNTFTVNGLPTGGLYLFDNNIHSPNTPGSPNTLSTDPPVPLEPCPESFMLRPFWLMRCLYQTIAHPRGGYISTKLFIPRDVWRVKNVKIKGVEEKVACCDLLTAALLKLAKVDTYDADAVLDEMQSFELIMDQVQSNLNKKLGNEVGVQSSAALFKGSPATEEASGHSGDPISSKSANAPGKSYLASWRKLRSKNSGAALTSTFTTSKDANRETLSMSSLPMTTSLTNRPPKRNVSQVQATGPNANYMASVARLFDAAQVLDSIARQVEDPGLKHSSSTHVGLELSSRHAAEFFGFYICRFVLNDVGMMLDKFIKRGSEWVMV